MFVLSWCSINIWNDCGMMSIIYVALRKTMHLTMYIVHLHWINAPNIFNPVDLQPQDLQKGVQEFTPGF